MKISIYIRGKEVGFNTRLNIGTGLMSPAIKRQYDNLLSNILDIYRLNGDYEIDCPKWFEELINIEVYERRLKGN